MVSISLSGFTHVDPFEDTESKPLPQKFRAGDNSFTHVDPFEDTERFLVFPEHQNQLFVSPTSIRSRILKAMPMSQLAFATVVSPTSIRSRILKGGTGQH